MKNHSPEIDFSFLLQTIFRLPQDDKSLSYKPFFVKLTDISERTVTCYILPCHTQTTDGTFNTNPVKPDIQLHGIFLPDMLRHPD